MTPTDSIEYILGRLDTDVETMKADMAEIKASMKRLEAFVNEVNGGKKLAFALAALLGSVATMITSWLVARFS